MSQLSIRKKILLGLFIGAIIPIFSLEVLDIYNARNELKTEKIKSLDAIVDIKKQYIESFFEKMVREVKLLSQLDSVKDSLYFVNENFDNKNSKKYLNAKEDLDSHLIPIKESEDLLEIILLNPQGVMVYNTGTAYSNKELGKTLKDPIGRNQIRNSFSVYISDVFESSFASSGFEIMSFSPVYGDDDSYLGTVSISADMDSIFELISNKTGLGETGETVLGRLEEDHILVINPLKYDKRASLSRKIFFDNDGETPIQEAALGNEGNGIVIDYRSREVIASWRHLDLASENIFWGLASKIDTEEAFAGSRRLFNQAIFLGLGSIFLLIFTYRYLTSSIVNPVQEISQSARKIAKGDLNTRINYEGKDEIGYLAKSFNNMTSELVQARSNLTEKNEKLEEANSQLEEKNVQVDRSKKAILNVLEDVQEEKDKTIRERNRIKAILESIGDGVFVVNTKYQIEAINPVAANLSGYKLDEAMGKPYKEIFHFVYEKNNKVNDRFIVEAIKTGQVQEMDNQTLLVKKDGTKIPVSDSAAPLVDGIGEIKGCVVVFRDVSKEYAIDKAKTEFVSLASHQLRTPLAAINWNVEMLLGDGYKVLDEENKQALEDVYSSSMRMTELVNALLNVSRIELGTFAVDPESVDIVVLAKEVVKDLQPKIDEKELELTEEYKPKKLVVNVDPKLMRMVIENLLSNSVKYTPEKKKIKLSILKRDKDFILEIKDEGYGIPKDQQEKIFTRLFRADNVQDRDVEGTGLGLYIVKSIIEHSEGEIWFESEEDKGTTFYVTLPLEGMGKKKGEKKLT